MKIGVDPLRAERLQLELEGGVQVRGNLQLDAAEAAVVGAGARVALGGGRLQGLEFTMARGLALRAEELAMPRGLTLSAERKLTVPELTCAEARLEIDDLLGLVSGGEAGAGGGEGGALSYDFLDAISGHLYVDLEVDLKVPVLGHRAATHEFRIPIDEGTIDFRRLEKDLSALEDSVIDFEVRGQDLVLEKDLPLVPFDNADILTWRLDEAGQALAKRDRVRLRTLPHFKLPAQSEPEPEGEPPVALNAIACRNTDIRLKLGACSLPLPGGAQLRLGGQDHVAVEELSITGEAQHRSGQALEPTTVAVALRGVHAALGDLSLGEAKLVSAALRLGALEEVTLRLEGFRPAGLQATVRDLAITDLELQL